MNLYTVVDKYDGLVKVGFAKNDISFIRAIVISVAKCVPLKDVDVFCVGEISDASGNIIETEYRLVPWDVYSLPETDEEALAPLGEEAVKAYAEAKKAREVKSE